MSRPLALKLYFALNGGHVPTGEAWASSHDAPEEDAPVVWAHCEHQKDMHLVTAFMLRLVSERDDIVAVITTGQGCDSALFRHPDLFFDEAPFENSADVNTFLSHWAPKIGLWYKSDLRPMLLDTAYERGLPMLLVDASDDMSLAPMCKASRGVRRALLRRFERIYAVSSIAVASLKKLTTPKSNVVEKGPIQISPPALECDDTDVQYWAEHLTNRPLVLGANTDEDDEAPMILAHRQILRAHHRLLLVIAPRNLDRGREIAKSLMTTGWSVAMQSLGEMPEDTTQIFIADTPNALPLWFRLAPISVLGGTFGSMPASDPLEPAGLGSALLHGPNTKPYQAHYKQFLDAGAARDVRTPDQLAVAVNDLLAPQRVAAMAHRAWDIITIGAEATDTIIDHVETRLDELGY